MAVMGSESFDVDPITRPRNGVGLPWIEPANRNKKKIQTDSLKFDCQSEKRPDSFTIFLEALYYKTVID